MFSVSSTLALGTKFAKPKPRIFFFDEEWWIDECPPPPPKKYHNDIFRPSVKLHFASWGVAVMRVTGLKQPPVLGKERPYHEAQADGFSED